MTKYEELIANLRSFSPEKAEIMEEEIDVIIHKLKFLPADSFPNVAILDQKDNFAPIHHPVLAEKVKLAGGNLSANLAEDPQVIIVIQSNSDLYTVLPSYLADLKAQKTRALLENKVFIIQNNDFQNQDEEYVRDTEILAEIIQPKYFFFGHDGEDWVKFDFA